MGNSNSSERESLTIKVRSRSGIIRHLSPTAFQKQFGIKYARHLVLDKSCFLQDSNEEVYTHLVYCEQIRLAHIADIYIEKVSDLIGFGVFANDVIDAEQMIGEYTGLARKMKDADCSNPYVFNYIAGAIIDASKRGNSMRFVNHSSNNPNCHYKRVLVDGIQHIIFVASRRISVGEQIVFDYGENYWKMRRAPQEI